MAKFVPLKIWVSIAVYLALASTPVADFFGSWLSASIPIMGQIFEEVITSRVVSGLIWGFLALIVVFQGWRIFWKLPWVGRILSYFVFPDLNGDWTVIIQSNWSIVDAMKEAAKSKKISFDPFKEGSLPDLLESNFDVRIKQFWFSTNVEFLPNEKTPLLKSNTISVEFFKADNGSKHVAWIFEVKNKQDNSMRLGLADEQKYCGAATLALNEDASELSGQYWQNRSWNRGLNAAGLIVLRRKC